MRSSYVGVAEMKLMTRKTRKQVGDERESEIGRYREMKTKRGRHR